MNWILLKEIVQKPVKFFDLFKEGRYATSLLWIAKDIFWIDFDVWIRENHMLDVHNGRTDCDFPDCNCHGFEK